MKMHFQSKADVSSLVEIEREQYKQLLQTKTGHELAVAVVEAMKVLDIDPRQSALDKADAFFSYGDVVSGAISPSELLSEVD